MKRKRKNRIIKIYMGIVVFFFLLQFSPMAGYANESAAVKLPVKQIFVRENGAIYETEDKVEYVLKGLETGNPLPGGNPDEYRITLNGNKQLLTEPINFYAPGVYSYEWKARIPNQFPYGWEDSAYKITIYVKSDFTTMVIIGNKNGEKTDTLTARYVFKDRDNGNHGGGDEDGDEVKQPTAPIAPTSPSATVDSNDLLPTDSSETKSGGTGIMVPPGEVEIRDPDGNLIWQGYTPDGYVDIELSPGRYEVTVIDENGMAFSYFIEVSGVNLARTGDESINMIWLILIMAGAASGGGFIIYLKRNGCCEPD